MMCSCGIFIKLDVFFFFFYQGNAIFLDSLKATGTDESAQNDSVLSCLPDEEFLRDKNNTDPCLKVWSYSFKWMQIGPWSFEV